MKFYLIAGILSMLVAHCQPARSDIHQEVIDNSLLEKLIQSADSSIDVRADSNTLIQNPMWVKGRKLYFKEEGTYTTLWYDEQNRPTGMVEYAKNTLKDSIVFYTNGQRMFWLTIDQEGKLNGPVRFFYPDGRVRMDGRFENGIQTGIWREFEPGGRLQETHEFDRYGRQVR